MPDRLRSSHGAPLGHWCDVGPQQFDGPAGVVAAQTPLDGYVYWLTLTLPPLAVLWLKRE